jgi:Transposase DDE domain
VFDQLQVVLLDELGVAGRIDLGRVSIDSVSLRAVKGGPDRRQPGRSRQARLQAAPGRRTRRSPISLVLSAANANDATMFEAVLDDIPRIRMPTGRRRRRPGKVHGDKAYDHRHCRAYLRRRGIRPRIARRMIEPVRRECRRQARGRRRRRAATSDVPSRRPPQEATCRAQSVGNRRPGVQDGAGASTASAVIST